MSGRSITLTRRRLFGGLLVVVVAAAATGAGTVAMFSDTEASSGNTISAGTLDLTLNGSDQSVTFLDVQNIKPGDSGSQRVSLENAGSVGGTLEIRLDDVRDYENGHVGNENAVDDSSGGELQEYLDVRPEIDGDNITNWVGVDQLQGVAPHTEATGVTIGPDGSRTFRVYWRFNDENGVDEAQSDRVEIDLTYRLVQGGS